VSISSVGSFLSSIPGFGQTEQARQNSPTASLARSERDAIREKGLTAWAHEQKIEALKERLRAEILSDRNLSEEGIAGLSSEQRTSVEDEIARLVEQKLKEAMEQAIEDAASTGQTKAVFLDIMA
jgi:hypothetical protein